MNCIKFLVFDEGRGFSRFLKMHFSLKYEIIVLKGDASDVYDSEAFNIAFIQINSMDNLIVGMVLAHYSKTVFWSSSNKEVQKILLDKEGFIYLNMELNKNEIVRIIKNHIEMIRED